MLRAQTFEGLFTLVPILLVAAVSIFLRVRAARRRKKREEAEGGAPARGAPARTAEKMQPSAVTRMAGPGRVTEPAPARGAPARGAPAQAAGRPTPASAAPFTPQQPSRPQVPVRESYAYPLPLSLDDLASPADAAAQPKDVRITRPVVRPSAESRTAFEKLAPSRQPQNLRERMQARVRPVQPAAEAAAGKGYSITAKLKRLPPLKRAVIWAEILGPPGGRQ